MDEEPVVILTGPRTVGKSTLLAALAAQFDRPVLDLDRPDARAAAASDPAFMVSGPGPVLIDEFQHVPEILDAIKAELKHGHQARALRAHRNPRGTRSCRRRRSR
jgi:predicted AAA+ superfamily ATPase